MSDSKNKCVIVGASQAGVNCAFALRKEGWEGEICLFDAEPDLPVYRPPLSKTVLTGAENVEDHLLKPRHLFEKEKISLHSGKKVHEINRGEKTILLDNGEKHSYSKLVLATGGRPVVPEIKGIEAAKNVFTLRTASDALNIRNAVQNSNSKQVVIIGAGYIGLETASSLTKLGAKVTVLERENRVLSRVASPEISRFFEKLHVQNGVSVKTGTEVSSIGIENEKKNVECSCGSVFPADLIVLGIGIQANQELAANAGLETENGILADASMKTSDETIFAIGDCCFHYNWFYRKFLRLESIQNANDQAKVAAASVCGKISVYSSIPWFWSDQYDVKLQIAGLSAGYNNSLLRKENENKFSVWYFKNDQLLAVDTVNDMKAYMLGTKFLKSGRHIDKTKLADTNVPLNPANLLV